MRAVRILLLILCIIFAMAAIQVNAALRSSENYGLQSDVTNQGGDKSTSTNYILRQGSAGQLGTVGQSDSSSYSAGQGYIYTINTKPSTPESLAQYQADGVTPIDWPGGLTPTTTEVMKMSVKDPDPGDILTPQIEVVLSGEAFSNSPSFEGDTYDYSGISLTASVSATELSYDNGYIWQARVKDQENYYSDWVPMGGDPDFIVQLSLSVSLRDASDATDYTTWEVGTGKEVDTVFIMSNSECVLVKNEGNVAEDFSITGGATNWTLSSTGETGEDICILMGLFNANTGPSGGDYALANDIVNDTIIWATESGGNGKFEGLESGENVPIDTGRKLYLYLKTPTSITTGDEERMTITIGCKQH